MLLDREWKPLIAAVPFLIHNSMKQNVRQILLGIKPLVECLNRIVEHAPAEYRKDIIDKILELTYLLVKDLYDEDEELNEYIKILKIYEEKHETR